MGFSDLGKKKQLNRTRIEFSNAEPLSIILKSHPINHELLLDLFEEKDAVLLDTAFLKRVEKEAELDDKVLSDLYFNHLVLAGGRLVKVTSNRSFQALLEAYKKFSQCLLTEDKEIGFQDKLIGLYLFGFYKDIAIENSDTTSRAEYNARLNVIAQCSKYTSMPGMIGKKEKFIAVASTNMANRALDTIKSMGETNTQYINLLYWGLVFVALLNDEVNPDMQNYFMTQYSKADEINGTFQRFLSAASD